MELVTLVNSELLKDPEFQDLAGPLPPDDLKELQNDIAEHGCISPIVVWREEGIILDGNNRFQICKEQGITYKVEEVSFTSREDALAWVITQQIARRNLPDFRKIELLIKRQKLLDLAKTAREKQLAKLKQFKDDSVLSKIDKTEPINIQRTIADELKISTGKVGMAQYILNHHDRIQPEDLRKLRTGEETIGRIYNKYSKREEYEARMKKLEERIRQLEPPKRRYSTIVMDVPWDYGRGSPNGDVWQGRVIGDYPTMSIEEIKNIKLPAEDDCVLWFWTTNAFLRVSFDIIEAYGFEYKTTLTWGKDKLGVGAYLQGQTEHCLLAFKGKPLFKGWTGASTLLLAKNRGHSRKPDEFYKLVDRTCSGPKLDYFGGKVRPGWDIYGTVREWKLKKGEQGQ